MCVWESVDTKVCVWRSKVHIKHLPLLFLTLFLRQGCPHWAQSSLTKQTGQWSLKIHLPLYAWVTVERCCARPFFFNVVSGDLKSSCSWDRHFTVRATFPTDMLGCFYWQMYFKSTEQCQAKLVLGMHTFINEKKFLITVQWGSEFIVEEARRLGSQVTSIRHGRMWRSRHRAEPRCWPQKQVPCFLLTCSRSLMPQTDWSLLSHATIPVHSLLWVLTLSLPTSSPVLTTIPSSPLSWWYILDCIHCSVSIDTHFLPSSDCFCWHGYPCLFLSTLSVLPLYRW